MLVRVRSLETFEKHPVHSLLQSELGVELPLHISLSRSLALTTDQRRPFLDAIERGIIELRIAPYAFSGPISYHLADLIQGSSSPSLGSIGFRIMKETGGSWSYNLADPNTMV